MSPDVTLLSRLRAKVDSAALRNARLLITSTDVVEALEAFMGAVVSNQEVADWAEFIDANEEIDLEENPHLPDVFFELSSPEINGLLDARRAAEIVALLSPRHQ